jgi:hypothetical protein
MALSRLAYLSVLGLGLALAACGDSSTGDGSNGTGDTDSDGGGGTSTDGGGGKGGADGAAGEAGGGGAAATAPLAPDLEMVMPMAGVLHVEWSTPEACDQIEAERKDPTHDYAVAFTVAGTKTSHMDPGAAEDMDYTYRLRCKVGQVNSDYSNEKSANPTRP